MGGQGDLSQIAVYGYGRLVGYNSDLELKPDIAEAVEVEAGRIFTIRLRRGHRWSDGHPFTSEDFRYWWEDVANHEELYPAGPPQKLRVDGELPRVRFPDERTIVYAWSKPNPTFLHDLAGALALYIYRPSHYMKRFHVDYAPKDKLAARIAEYDQRDWADLHTYLDSLYDQDNPDLPTLQPWVNTTRPPSQRFLFERNPFYHRVDPQGRQLPYIDRLVVKIASPSIIPAKTGAGESDLQARYIRFDNYTFLKEAEDRFPLEVRLWKPAYGSKHALYPNLNANDAVWRELIRDVRFRRALSLAIHRYELNQVIYYGLALEGNNTVLPRSPLYKDRYREVWADFRGRQGQRAIGRDRAHRPRRPRLPPAAGRPALRDRDRERGRKHRGVRPLATDHRQLARRSASACIPTPPSARCSAGAPSPATASWASGRGWRTACRPRR